MIIESLTKSLNRTELETVLWTCHLSLLFTIGFSASLEEFSFLAVLSDLDRWKYFKESPQIKYSYIVHKHLLSLWRFKRNSPPWWVVTYFSQMKVPSSSLWLPNFILTIFISLTTFCLIANYLNNTNSHSFNSVPLGLQGYANCPEVTIYWVSNMAETGQPFVFSKVNIIIKSKYPASSILDKLTAGQNLNCYSR